MKRDNYFEKYDKAKSIATRLTEMANGKEVENTSFTEWLHEEEAGVAFIKKMSDETNIKAAYNEFDEIEKQREQNIGKVLLEVTKRKAYKRKIIVLRTAIASCAAAITVLSMLVYHDNQKEKSNTLAYEMETLEKPTLILSNGKSIDLKTQNETIIDDKTEIDKDKNSLSYKNAFQEHETAEETFHSLIIPRLQTYTVTLSDGTEITLNANSKLRYPTTFKGETRNVQLEGEAYFKVSKAVKPFIVTVNGAEIKVYGTEFNINSHMDNHVYTTLISGSVGVTPKSGQEVMMKPNQLSIVNLSKSSCNVSDVSVSQYVSWMNGDFIYEDASIVTMLNDVAAWYGVEINYDAEKFREITVNAAFNRKEPFTKILKAIGEIANVKFVKIDQNNYAIEEQ